MNKQLKSSAIILALLTSTSVFAAEHIHPGYTETTLTDNEVVRNSYNECWQNSFLETKSPECGGEAPAPAPAPAQTTPAYQDSTISLSNEFLFAFDKATLRHEAVQTLNNIVSKLKEPGLKIGSISVEGNTDFMGKQAYNQKLSERRAKAVKDYLVKQGVSAESVSAVGLGETKARMTAQCQKKVAHIKNKAKRIKAQIQCIAPDRRVDIKVHATKKVEVVPNQGSAS